MKFRKKPVEIDAIQWWQNGDHPLDFPAYTDPNEAKEQQGEGRIVRYYRHPENDEHRRCDSCGVKMKFHGWIDTLEGGHVVCPGDYVITGANDERYPCKPDVFEKTYEPVIENGGGDAGQN